MKKLLWIVIVLIVIIAGGALWWSLIQPATPSITPSFDANENATSTNAPVITPTGTGTVPTAPTGPSTMGNIIDPGSGAAPIVGNNLMLGIDENAKLGTYLIGYTGMTLYTYEKDGDASSTCYAACAKTWPPYIVSGSDTINTQYGVNASKVSIIARADGSLQVAYDNHPLYFYSGDTQETTNGQGVGGVWYVQKP